MEYLMTYSWAILVVIIVGVVIWQMGLFDLGGKEMPGYSGFSIVVPRDWEMTYIGGSQCTFSVQFSNGAGEDIGTLAMDGNNCNPNNISAGGWTVCSKATSCTGAGDHYDETVIATYTRIATGENFQSAGTFWGAVG